MKTTSILAAALAAVALALGACSTTSQGEGDRTAGTYVDDATVTAKVKTAIATDVGVKAAANVNVETHKGTVQLSGFADSAEQASRAVSAAQKVSGVKTVQNDIRVK
ncbi:MAG TPA: BON domain-containing protein [Burkholderiales bacterium]|nr:BON domain-containing protein [Burkholderiales bacterium]